MHGKLVTIIGFAVLVGGTYVVYNSRNGTSNSGTWRTNHRHALALLDWSDVTSTSLQDLKEKKQTKAVMVKHIRTSTSEISYWK